MTFVEFLKKVLHSLSANDRILNIWNYAILCQIMKRINYTAHLELRLKLRDIPYDLPAKIYKSSKEW